MQVMQKESRITTLKKYGGSLAVVLPVLILVLLKSTGSDNFKTDAEDRATVAAVKSSLIGIRELSGMVSEKILIVRLDTVSTQADNLKGEQLAIESGSILDPSNIKAIRKNEGPVVLVSSDLGMAARMWMLLRQTGCKNLYILNSAENGN